MGEGEREGNPSVSFADSIPQFAMVVLLRSQVRLRLSLASLGSSYRPALRWSGIPGLRTPFGRVLAPPPLRGFDRLTSACFAHCARPSCAPLAAPPLSPSLGSSYRPALRWPGIPGLRTPFGRVLAPPPLRGFDRLTSRCFAHSARASCASPLGKGSLLGSGVTVGSSPTKSLLFPEGKREVARRKP